MTPRVLIAPPASSSQPGGHHTVALSARQHHHLLRVLRLRPGDAVEAFDGRGTRWNAILIESDGELALELGARSRIDTSGPLDIHLGQCLSTADRMDWTVEKSVELGVRRISPLSCARSQIRLDASRAARKLEHWRAIIEAACMQSGCDSLPELHPVQELKTWVQARDVTHRLLLDPRSDESLSAFARRAALRDDRICLLVGPESGLSDDEMSAAIASGFNPVRLGPRTLRTETAGLAAISALQALAGDF